MTANERSNRFGIDILMPDQPCYVTHECVTATPKSIDANRTQGLQAVSTRCAAVQYDERKLHSAGHWTTSPIGRAGTAAQPVKRRSRRQTAGEHRKLTCTDEVPPPLFVH